MFNNTFSSTFFHGQKKNNKYETTGTEHYPPSFDRMFITLFDERDILPCRYIGKVLVPAPLENIIRDAEGCRMALSKREEGFKFRLF